MEVGQNAKCGTLCLRRHPYPILRVDPDEAYHELVVCTIGVLACGSTFQPDGIVVAWLDGREPSGLADLSSALGRRSGDVYPAETETDASPYPSTRCFVVVCSSQLSSAFAAQPGTGRVVVAQRMPRVYADHGLALGALVVAGSGGRLAGAAPSTRVAEWVLAVVARTAHVGRGLSLSDAAPGQVRGWSGIGCQQNCALPNAWDVWTDVRAR